VSQPSSTAAAACDPAPGEVAIRLAGVSKTFKVLHQSPFLMHTVLRNLFGRRHQEPLVALENVSFEIRRGESVVFVGRNGAGKSTLLGLIAGTSVPSAGTVSVHGRIGALLELGTGFHPDLTGRENIFLNASLNGLSNDQIDERYDRIVAFSELADFMDVAISRYSSGMFLRLAFAVAVHLDPEIMIVDEALAVGDQQFQKKCKQRVRELLDEGRSLLFVSHQAAEALQLCRRAIWLEQGRVMRDGPAAEVLAAYEASLEKGTPPALRGAG
jgi:ABC-type polysaccharide/polyol phosphate transport system ATPase subunit